MFSNGVDYKEQEFKYGYANYQTQGVLTEASDKNIFPNSSNLVSNNKLLNVYYNEKKNARFLIAPDAARLDLIKESDLEYSQEFLVFVQKTLILKFQNEGIR